MLSVSLAIPLFPSISCGITIVLGQFLQSTPNTQLQVCYALSTALTLNTFLPRLNRLTADHFDLK